jgi:hypothetical protein
MKVSAWARARRRRRSRTRRTRQPRIQLSRFKDRLPSTKRGPRDGVNVAASLPLTGGRELTLAFEPGADVVLHGLGAGQRSRVELSSQLGGRMTKASFDLTPEASDEALRIVVADPSDVRAGLEIQRLSGPGGSVISTHTPDVD